MKIAAITFGTEGDTRPMAALCKGLADAGHDTCFLTEKSGVSLASSAGVRTIALSGDIKSNLTELLSSGSKASGASAMTEAYRPRRNRAQQIGSGPSSRSLAVVMRG